MAQPVLVFCWTAAAVLVADWVLVPPPPSPGRVAAALPGLIAASVATGAVAGLPGARAANLAAALVGSLVGHALSIGVAASFAPVMQGNTVVIEPAVYAPLVMATVAVLVGVLLVAQLASATMRRRTVPGSRALIAAVAAVASGAALLGILAAASPIVLDPASPLIHRIHAGPAGIELDAASIPAGRVIWLATVEPGAPRDLVLFNEAERELNVLDMPPDGAEDYLLLRQTFTPGSWSFAAGDGRFSASFEVTP
ncbi:MAG TPA: hypothetical protein VFY23_04205 [Candidatus Limnocylindrales bacterium]|nr:hypothetical protein [Candidatus Limnocylindrales bacterium]